MKNYRYRIIAILIIMAIIFVSINIYKFIFIYIPIVFAVLTGCISSLLLIVLCFGLYIYATAQDEELNR